MPIKSEQFLGKKEKQTGTHYTPRELAEFVAEQLASVFPANSGVVLDPACGDGELLRAFSKKRPSMRLLGFDLDEEALSMAESNVGTGEFRRADFVEIASEYRNGGLFAPSEQVDAVIANPPYVRTQVLGADRSQEIAKAFGLKGRVDLYFVFIEGIAEILKAGGVAAIIVSNRFMTTKAGETVRSRILEKFDIIHVWDLGDTKLFDAAVLPAVLILRKKRQPNDFHQVARMSSIYTTDCTGGQIAATIPEALNLSGNIQVDCRYFNVQHGILDHSKGTWRVGNEESDSWLAAVRERTWATFGDLGKIRVGIKTTADKVFVRKEWDSPEPELLRPLLTHKSARRYRSLPPEKRVLYTHIAKGGKKVAVNLDEFPNSKAYLESHRDTLEKRGYVIKAGRKWFEIWVPHLPALWEKPKLVWPDISVSPTFWMSVDGELVQGDCYWLSPEAGKEELLWLALAVANSSFIEEFYDRACGNKLYAGRRRFMTQYVEQFPLPNPSLKESRKIVSDVKKLYDMPQGEKADLIARRLNQEISAAFGVASKEISR